MSAFVVPFLRKKLASTCWTQAELAEFYRVEAALITAGMRVHTDHGVTDEGEPWFVFYHADDEQDVIIHFARIDGSYMVNAASLGGSEVGDDFRVLVRQLLARYDEIAARRREAVSGGNVVLHPAAMLWVLVALAFLKSAEARAPESNPAHHGFLDHDPAIATPRDAQFSPLSAMISYALQSIIVTWAAAAGALASEVHMVTDATIASWLTSETSVVPAAATASDASDHAALSGPENFHGAQDAVWTAHVGSSSPEAQPAAPSERPALDHASDHAMADGVQAAGVHSITDIAPVQTPLAADPPPAHPTGEADAVLVSAEANTGPQNVQNLPAVPNVIAAALGHAIHPSIGGDIDGAATGLNDTGVGPSNGATSHFVAPAVSPPAVPLAGPISTVADPGAGHAVVTDTPATVSTPTPALTPAQQDQAETAIATSAVQIFLASVPDAKTIAIQNTLIIYDPLAVDIDQSHLQALTFDFSDGSHISLVGLPSELTHALTGHT